MGHPHSFVRCVLLVLVVSGAQLSQAQPLPEITRQPENQFVQLGSNAVFELTATGQEPLTYRWWRQTPPSPDWVSLSDDGRISGASTPTLTIANAQLGDQANYRGLVYDRQNDIGYSDIVTLTIVYPPSISLQPTDGTVLLGETAEFVSAATGTGPMIYHWQHDGMDIPGAGQTSGPATVTLIVSNAQPGASGEYRMVVTNAYGSASSSTATLVVVDAPMIESQPSSTASSIGGIALFTAEAIGPGPMFYQWQKDGVDLPAGGRFSGVTGPVLYISSVQVSDAGQYRLVVSNVHGVTQTSEAHLRVVPLRAWGDDNHGAVTVPLTITNPVAIAAGVDHTVVLQADGTVFTWGYPLPPPVGLTDAVAIAAGDYHGLALREDGTVAAWGANGSGESSVPAGLSNVVAIAAGAGHSLALRDDGTVVGWGNNGGYGGVTCNQATPPPTLTDVASVAAGIEYSLALFSDGTVLGWGCNSLGRASPPFGLDHVVAIDAEWNHSLALKSDGTVVGWGDNSFGQVNIPAGLSNVTAIAGGNVYGLALKRDGTVVGWGSGVFGPILPPEGLSNVVAIAGGEAHGVALVESPATQVPPAIRWNPPARYLPVGQTRVLRPYVHGALPMEFQWYFNGSPLAGETNLWLVLSPLQTHQSGAYQLRATNGFGTDSSSVAILNVLEPPGITQPPVGETRIRGESVTLSAGVSGSSPLGYQWFFDGNPLSDDGRISGSTTPSLTVTDLQTGDRGAYSLLVSNAVGKVTSEPVYLEVLGEPILLAQPESRYGFLTEAAGFSVSAVGMEPLSYQWYLDGNPLSDDGFFSSTDGPALVLENIQPSHAGDYTVVLSNAWGAVTSSVATLTIATRRYVDAGNPTPAAPYTSWSTAARVIQQAIDVAGPGDEIRVADGTYATGGKAVHASLVSRVAVDKPVVVRSVNGPQVTVIRGVGSLGNSAVRCAYLTNNATLIGFTLQNGGTRTTGNFRTEGSGGGLLCESASAVVSNCVFLANRANVFGGGAYFGTFHDCTFDDNSAEQGGGVASGTLYRCVLSGNSATWGGGAVYGTLNDCIVVNNMARDPGGARLGEGGGVYRGSLTNCTLAGNYARVGGGGGIWVTLVNCLVTGNSALNGGGATAADLVLNCTVVGNSAFQDSGTGGGFGGGVSGATVINSIIVSNQTSLSFGGNNYYGGSMVHSCSHPLPDGTGNIAGDPQFVDFAGGNYRLRSISPCINSGSNDFAATGVDADGLPRIVDGTVDMGAYEFQQVPWVIFSPSDQTVVLGTEAVFSLFSVGAEPVSYQWQKDGAPLADNGRIVGAGTASLTISDVLATDAGGYRAVVSNEWGSAVSATATLTVLLPPSIETHPVSQAARAGSNVTFSVSASGTPTLAYHWRREGTNLNNGDNISGATTPTVHISNVATNDGATYDVVVSNPYGSVTSAPAVLTLLPLSIVAEAASQFVPAGSDVNLQVEAIGPYPIGYQWRFNGTILPGSTNAILGLTNVQSGDAGSYDVIVNDSFTALTSAVATVTVTPSAPWFVSQPESLVATSGETAVLEAAAVGTEPVQFQWQHEGTNLVGQTAATLTLPTVDSRASGSYRLVASNGLGTAVSAEAVLSVIQLRIWGQDDLPLLNLPASATNLVQIAMGGLMPGPYRTIALQADGTVLVWRSDGSPEDLPAEATNVVKVAAGLSHGLALRADRTVLAWGTGSAAAPVPPEATNVIDIAAGPTWSAAVRADGRVVGWGFGRILPSPQSPPPDATNLVALSGGYWSALGIHADGTLMRWSGPSLPEGASNVICVDVSEGSPQAVHNVALQSDGTVLGWGTQYPPPAEATNVMAIAAGDACALALREDGRVLSWGWLAAPAGLTNALAIEAGSIHGLAIVRDPYLPVPPPRMGIQPEGSVVETGGRFVLRASLVGAIPARYQWRFNGKPVPAPNAPWLHLAHVHPRQAGDYVMVASSEFGSVTSAVATVTVSLPQPTLQSHGVTTNGFNFAFESVDEVLYVTEYRTTLTSGPWTELERRFGTGGVEVVTDPDTGATTRFYRVWAVYAPAPELGMSVSSSEVGLSIPSIRSANYVLEYKDRLNDPVWLQLQERAGTGAALFFKDPAPHPSSRFYRIRVR